MADDWKTNWTRVWIIGASSGMGRALAQRFANAGVEVIASARSEDKLQALAHEAQGITPLPLDVLEPDAVKRAVQDMAHGGSLPDLTLVCSAIYEPGGIDALTHEAASKHMAVNYLGAVAVIEALYPHLKTRGAGAVAIVASLTAYCGLPMASLYGPTKAALASLCETLSPEFERDGLGLRLINPGFVNTPLTAKNSFSMPFIMEPEEAADRILKGLGKGGFEIAFPMRLALILRFMRLLPYRLYFALTGRMVS